MVRRSTVENNLDLTRIFHEFEAFICKAFRDVAVLMLPQVPDNAANGRLRLAHRVKTFMLACQNEPGTKCHLKNSTQTGFKALNIFKKMNLHKNFHEMFGPVSIHE